MSRKHSAPTYQESDLKANQRKNLDLILLKHRKKNLGFKIPLLICCIPDHGIATFQQIEIGNWEVHSIKYQMLYVIINVRVTLPTRTWLY